MPAHARDDGIIVTLVLPGDRWEVEFLADGSSEIERFVTTGTLCNEDVLAELFAKYTG